jgi:hypothetical protein
MTEPEAAAARTASDQVAAELLDAAAAQRSALGEADTCPTREASLLTVAADRIVALQELAGAAAFAGEGFPSIACVAMERARQVLEEGYDAEHDREHQPGELAHAGACYIDRAVTILGGFPLDPDHHYRRPGTDGTADADLIPTAWPWGVDAWKPDDVLPGVMLVKGVALVCAELDRAGVTPGNLHDRSKAEALEAELAAAEAAVP